MATATETVELKRQREVFDLNTMDEILLRKIGTFTPVKTLEEAKHRVGGDTVKFLEIINEGLEAEAGRALLSDESIPWLMLDEEGKIIVGDDGKPVLATSVLPADKKIVNGLILNLAKSIYGYLKCDKKDAAGRKAAKEKAREMIKNTPEMKDGLVANAVATSGEIE